MQKFKFTALKRSDDTKCSMRKAVKSSRQSLLKSISFQPILGTTRKNISRKFQQEENSKTLKIPIVVYVGT